MTQQQIQYDAEEIHQWKKLIYGTPVAGASNTNEDWVNVNQDPNRRNAKKYGGSMPNFSKNIDSVSISAPDIWLHSRGNTKRSYNNHKNNFLQTIERPERTK